MQDLYHPAEIAGMHLRSTALNFGKNYSKVSRLIAAKAEGKIKWIKLESTTKNGEPKLAVFIYYKVPINGIYNQR